MPETMKTHSIESLTTGLPRYKCHKEVHADKIVAIDDATLRLNHGNTVSVSPSWINKNNPEVGGFYVVYKDGYTSFSPAEAFEDGYTRIR